jgi:hypothetical protein
MENIDWEREEWERKVSRLAHAAYDEIERRTISPERKRHAHDGIREFRKLLLANYSDLRSR